MHLADDQRPFWRFHGARVRALREMVLHVHRDLWAVPNRRLKIAYLIQRGDGQSIQCQFFTHRESASGERARQEVSRSFSRPDPR